ncbi:hypothetical protein SAMN05421776_105366 [Nocardia farcinica]|uniref:Uncharacterized protein n=1 Tax=Nocardia farcinica TaxID=37329 RepID=A0A0H5NEQ4_NOCFR|nr:hypothetical protein [Nocardia farcinica]PFX04027.1 hypothetical protein CJ469_01901 [Nocardia farcinica]PFX10185.1 hypothetical protein CJ468_01032 [Nocardia farcinica]CRY73642.1 Uncharacterised protein [Nocardia farcinica]SIT24929.1 hypothetical protein SAMN05421776_105366 [Nocardia farcinica]
MTAHVFAAGLAVITVLSALALAWIGVAGYRTHRTGRGPTAYEIRDRIHREQHPR